MSQPQSNTLPTSVQGPSDPAARYLLRKLGIIAAVVEGRLVDAHRLLLDLLADIERTGDDQKRDGR